MTLFERIVQHGTQRYHDGDGSTYALERVNPNWITCRDGFRVSVVAGWAMMCMPRPGWGDTPDSYSGPYTHVEVGFPSETPEPWELWMECADDGNPENCDPTEIVYADVPVEMVKALIDWHGGEADG